MSVVTHILKRGTSQNELEAPGMSWNYLEQAGTTWNKLEPPGTSWNGLRQGGTTCNKMDSARSCHRLQEIHRKKLLVQHHCQIEYNIPCY